MKLHIFSVLKFAKCSILNTVQRIQELLEGEGRRVERGGWREEGGGRRGEA
jgi:hypothetical protein